MFNDVSISPTITMTAQQTCNKSSNGQVQVQVQQEKTNLQAFLSYPVIQDYSNVLYK